MCLCLCLHWMNLFINKLLNAYTHTHTHRTRSVPFPITRLIKSLSKNWGNLPVKYSPSRPKVIYTHTDTHTQTHTHKHSQYAVPLSYLILTASIVTHSHTHIYIYIPRPSRFSISRTGLQGPDQEHSAVGSCQGAKTQYFPPRRGGSCDLKDWYIYMCVCMCVC